MDDREKQKRELIVVRYEKLRKRVKDWENAIYKTERRKPNSDDMRAAPKDVQDSYREYIKLKKYLSTKGEISLHKDANKALTPGKIFLGNKRPELQRNSKTSYLVQTPAKMFSSRPSFNSRKNPTQVSKKPSGLGLRSSKHSTTSERSSATESSPGTNLPFKKLFKLAGDKEKAKPNDSNSFHNDELTSSEPMKVTDMKSLKLPFSKKINVSNSSPVQFRENTQPDNENSIKFVDESAQPPTSLLKSPRVKIKPNVRSTKVDAGWLARLDSSDPDQCFEEDLISSNIEKKSISANSSGSDFGISRSPDTNKLDSSHDSLSHDNENMEVDVDENHESRKYLLNENSAGVSKITNENSDSGFCVGSVFKAAEVHQAIEEVFNETSKSSNPNASGVSFSDADASLLYSFSEDACLPSDPDELTLDSHTMSNILQVLSEDIENTTKQDSNSTHVSREDEAEDANSKKRPARFAFTPSPQKPVKPRKFFKSSRGERMRPAYTNSPTFGPLSPLKGVQSKRNRNPSGVLTNAASKLVSKSKKMINMANVEEDLKPLNKGRISEAENTGKRAGQTRPKKIKITYMESDSDPEKSVNNGNTEPSGSSRKNTVIDVFDEAPAAPTTVQIRKKGRKTFGGKRKNETLDSKIQNGKLDDNFVRIDTKRKVFVRGHKKISASKLKRLDWKNKKMLQGKSDPKSVTSSFTCFKCGEKGHFAKFCMKDVYAGSGPSVDIPEDQQDNSPFPTLEEAAMMIYKPGNASSNRVNIYTSTDTKQLDDTQQSAGTQGENPPMEASIVEDSSAVLPTPTLIQAVDPVFTEEFSDPALEEETMLEGLAAFGYDTFRPGQKEAVLRVLKGLSTLLILSTGAGKSLCYQLPAYLYAQKYPGALTLCISPLVSLMEDQVQGLPSVLNAACLHSNMTQKQKDAVLDKVKSKQLHVLLVSPEAVCGGLFGILRGTSDAIPTISFACIDEVHCVSQWSHNFRPSYLQLCKILREKLNVQTILGLTATATKTTADSICEHISIDPSTVIRGELIPRNLNLSVSKDVYKDEALITLLEGDRFRSCDSIIIYCTRREECERIATFVRTRLQEITETKVIKTKSRARLSGNCEAYHAGMTARKRKNVQEGFMSGAIRIVVATVAFGMGIDKSDIRAIIHYNMPSAFESYVQEIGRAGRDGLPAHCHLFLDCTKRNDLAELKRHVYVNSVDRPTIRKLLRKAFQSCKCQRIRELQGNASNDKKIMCEGHEVSFSIENTVTDLDLPKENITTLLCYLELGPKKWIEMLPLTYEMCKIQSYGGSKALKFAAARCPPLAVAIALQKEKKQFYDTDTFIEFNVIEAAATVGWNSQVVKKELKSLEWIGYQMDPHGKPTRFRKSGLMVEFSNLAYRVRSKGSLSDKDADEVLNYLHGRNVNQEQTKLNQLNRVYHALLSVSFPNINNLCETFDEEKSNQLKKFIHEYFSDDDINSQDDLPDSAADINVETDKVEELRRSIRRLIDSNKEVNFSTRAIARIFQGIGSPCFPAEYWYKSRDFWRRYLDVDFHLICRIASEEL